MRLAASLVPGNSHLGHFGRCGADLRSAGGRDLRSRAESETPPTGRPEVCPTGNAPTAPVAHGPPRPARPGLQWGRPVNSLNGQCLPGGASPVAHG